MNRESIFLASAAAAAGFAAGLLLAPALLPRPGNSLPRSATASAAGAANTATADRSLPFGPNYIPRSTAELIAALEDACRETSPSHSEGRIYWLAAQITPANAKQVIEALAKSKPGYGATSELFASWARRDPAAALACAEAPPDQAMREAALAGALEGWAENNPTAAADWVEKFPSDSLESATGLEILESLARVDPARALRLAARSRDDFQSAQSLRPFLSEFTKRDPRAAAELAATLPSGAFRSSVLTVVAQQWALADHEAALAWIATWPEGHPSRNYSEGFYKRPADAAMEESLADWVAKDFEPALAWIQNHPDAVAGKVSIARLAEAAVQTSPTNAIRLAAIEPPGKARDDALQQIARAWAATDPGAALAWAESQADAKSQGNLVESILSAAANNDPRTAAALAAKLPQDQQRKALADVAVAMTFKNPAAAADWAGTFSDAGIRDGLLQTILHQWAQEDPVAAQQRLLAMPAGTDRDELAEQLCAMLDSDEPQLASRLIRSMQDPAKRAAWTEKLAEDWMRNDPAAGRAWIANSDLAADVKNRLLATPAAAPDSSDSGPDLLPEPEEH